MNNRDLSYEQVLVVLNVVRIIFTYLIAIYVLGRLYDDVIFREDYDVYEESYSVTSGEFKLPVIAVTPQDPPEIHTLVDDRTDEQKFEHRIFSYAMAIGSKYGIEPSLILAVAKKESRFNPDANGSGAIGLMQVIPSCHKDRIARLEIQDLYDPYENMLVGADILAYLCNRYDDLGLVLMCYNMGEGGGMAKYNSSGYSDYAKIVLGYKEEIERSESYGKICHQEKIASSDAGDSRTKMHRVGVCPSSGTVR